MQTGQLDVRPKICGFEFGSLSVPMNRVRHRSCGGQGGFLPRGSRGFRIELLGFVVHAQRRVSLLGKRALERIFGRFHVAVAQRFLSLGLGGIVGKQNLTSSGDGAFDDIYR